jgi:hypothetical protein
MEIDQEKFTEAVIDLSNVLYFQSSLGKTHFALPKARHRSKSFDVQNAAEVDIRVLLETSREIVKTPAIKDRLCAGLKSISKDLTETSKLVVGILLPLSLASKSTIPLNPMIFAGISLFIFNAGINSICRDEGKY